MSSQYPLWGLRYIPTGFVGIRSLSNDYDEVCSRWAEMSMKDRLQYVVVEVEIREVKKRKAVKRGKS